MSDTARVVQIDAETLETLKAAAWLWSAEPSGDDTEVIRRACYAANSALFAAPATSEAEKVVCPNCEQNVSDSDEHRGPHKVEGIPGTFWTCRRPQPEPGAPEMPEAVSTALKSMRFTASNPRISDAETKGLLDNADALESFWRNSAQPGRVESYQMPEDLRRWAWRAVEMLCVGQSNAEDEDGKDGGRLFMESADELAAAIRNHPRQRAAQPVRVGMTEELELVLSVAEVSCEKYEAAGYKDAPKSWRTAIAAVRQQAAQPPRLEKVREALEAAVDRMEPEGCDCNEPHDPPCALCLCKVGLAELDAQEGKGEGRG